jgi:hypothetical protein
MTLISSDDIFRIVHSESVSTTKVNINYYASEFYSYSIPIISRLSFDTLDVILLSDSLWIVDEDWLLNILSQINVKHSFLICRLRVEYFSSESISQLCDLIEYHDLREDIWTSIVNHLERLYDEDFRQWRFLKAEVSRFDSTVISRFPDILNEFRNWKHKLLYRDSWNGFGSLDFHAKCDGQSHTITLIRTTKNLIFSVYTPLSWDSMSGSKPDSSHRSFMFKIISPHNRMSRKFTLKPDHSQCSIYCNSSYGPIFWSGQNQSIQ